MENQLSVNVTIKDTVDVKAEEYFKLICPVREYDWIPGWKCEIIHYPEGHMSEGVIFDEISSSLYLTGEVGEKTKWTCLVHDPKNYRVHFSLDNVASSSLYRIEAKPIGENKIEYTLNLTYKPLNLQGENVIKNNGTFKIKYMLTLLSLLIKHYLENGSQLEYSKIIKTVSKFKHLTLVDFIKFAISRKKMESMQDVDRIKYLKGLPIVKIKAT